MVNSHGKHLKQLRNSGFKSLYMHTDDHNLLHIIEEGTLAIFEYAADTNNRTNRHHTHNKVNGLSGKKTLYPQ